MAFAALLLLVLATAGTAWQQANELASALGPLAQTEHERQRTVLLALVAATLLLACALCGWVMHRVLAPLRLVIQVARQLAAGSGAVQPAEDADDGADDGIAAIGSALNQVAARMQAHAHELQQARDCDALTGLPLRPRFLAACAASHAPAGAQGRRLAAVCFDIGRLPSINASLGHEAAEQAVLLTAQRAAAHVASTTDLARLGGGRFAALLTLQPGDTALQRALALQGALDQPLHWQGHVLDLGVTVGAAHNAENGAEDGAESGAEDGEPLPDLLRRAEQALHEAQRVHSTLGAYTPGIETARQAHLGQLAALQRAIERQELVPFLQPRWCPHTLRVVGAAARLQWQHPQRGWLPAPDFMPFAESTGRSGAITRRLLQVGIDLLRTDLGHLQLAVHITSTDLRDPGLVPLLQTLLKQAGVPPEKLLLEVAAGGLLEHGDEPAPRLAALRALGVGVAIGSVGRGPTSLACLQRLPATELHIDPGLVGDADASIGRQQMLCSLIDMAHTLNLVVAAQGVSTEAERALLQAVGCDLLQGDLLGPPVAAADFVRRYVPAKMTTPITTTTATAATPAANPELEAEDNPATQARASASAV